MQSNMGQKSKRALEIELNVIRSSWCSWVTVYDECIFYSCYLSIWWGAVTSNCLGGQVRSVSDWQPLVSGSILGVCWRTFHTFLILRTQQQLFGSLKKKVIADINNRLTEWRMLTYKTGLQLKKQQLTSKPNFITLTNNRKTTAVDI